MRIIKINEIIEFHARISEKHYNLRIPYDNYENTGTHIIPYENNENHENLEISIENHCYEHIRISRESTKLMKILEFNARMTKIMKTIEFHKRIMKIIKINEFQLKNNENH